ncbi:MAG TPA: hypothetical protein VF250_06670 [Conexibacter sp.]
MSVLELDSRLELPVGGGIRVVAVLDDDRGQAKAVGFQLEDEGLEALVVDLDEIPTVDDAVAWVSTHAHAVICDLQLSPMHDGIAYDGAQLVARLVSEHRIPCVLTTGFAPDVGMLVRPHRHTIPVLLTRDQTEQSDVLIEGLTRCAAEIREGRDAGRRTYRVPLFVERAGMTQYGVALDARVGGWAHKTPMRFPAWMLGEEYAIPAEAEALVGKVFFAHVNLGAKQEPDLFFEAPEVEFIEPDDQELHFG